MAKKKVYGEGSVTEREDGRFQVSVPGIDGKRRYAYAKNEKEAEKLRRQLLAEVEQGKLPPSKQPFETHAREWLEKKKREGGKPNSYLAALYCMDAHFIPAFGHLPLNKLNASHIEQFYHKLLDKGLNPNTIRKYQDTLKVCLDSAVKKGKLHVNPCGQVELPKKKKPKNNHLSQEEALNLLEAVKQHKLFSVLVPLALASEARESELLALIWDDVDFEQGTISITKTLTKTLGDDNRLFLQAVTPKSESGIREISLPDFALEVLRNHRTAQTKKMMATGWRNKKNLVFVTRNGGWYWPGNVSDMFDHFVSQRGFNITFHDLRHTGATLLLEAGVPANVVQERLGHADIATTLRTYAHVTKRMKDQSTGTLDSLFSGKQNTNFEAI
jgi:integrase